MAYSQIFLAWINGASFVIYTWNFSLVDETEIIFSFTVKDRIFTLPIGLALNPPPKLAVIEGKMTLRSSDILQRVVAQQREILKLLNSESRKIHHELKNDRKIKVIRTQ